MSSRVTATDRGAGTMLAVCILMVITLACGLGVWTVGWIAGVRQARAAADLSALAAVQARLTSDRACAAADRVAAANRSELVDCDVSGDARDVVVRVRVRTRLRPELTGSVRWVLAEATAGSMPR